MSTYRVTVETYPWTKLQTVGYYDSEYLAHQVAKIVRDHNMERVMGGVGLRCERIRRGPLDRNIVVKGELDVAERDRLIRLRFGETIKRTFEEEDSSQLLKGRKLVHQVSVKTHPWTQKAILVGYYAYREDALEVARMISDHNMQRLQGGIDVFCDPYSGDRIDSFAAVKMRLDVGERDRIMELRFKEGPIEEVSADEIEELFGWQTSKSLFKISQPDAKQVAQNFAQGARSARKYAHAAYGEKYHSLTFSFEGTGICSSSIGPQELDPSAPQSITCIVEKKNGEVEFKNLGTIRLDLFKTAEEIEAEIRRLIDSAFKSIDDPTHQG